MYIRYTHIHKLMRSRRKREKERMKQPLLHAALNIIFTGLPYEMEMTQSHDDDEGKRKKDRKKFFLYHIFL